MDSSNLKTEVEAIIKEELRPLAVKTEVKTEAKTEPKTEATPAVSLATVRGRTLEPAKLEPREEPGLAGCPLAHDPVAQLAALAPVRDEEEPEEPEEPPASQAVRVASIHTPFKREYREPDPPGEEGGEDDPFGLGPRRSRSPPASRAQLRSLSATASQKPRKKSSFYPSR